jgi:hypothetical protein
MHPIVQFSFCRVVIDTYAYNGAAGPCSGGAGAATEVPPSSGAGAMAAACEETSSWGATTAWPCANTAANAAIGKKARFIGYLPGMPPLIG